MFGGLPCTVMSASQSCGVGHSNFSCMKKVEIKVVIGLEKKDAGEIAPARPAPRTAWKASGTQKGAWVRLLHELTVKKQRDVCTNSNVAQSR